jgi:hypothetical protein
LSNPCWRFKGWRYGAPWLGFAWAADQDEAMQQARAAFGPDVTCVPERIEARYTPLLIHMRQVVLERDKIPLSWRVQLWIGRVRLGFLQERFKGHKQLLRVWQWGRMWWEVRDWGIENNEKEATAWLDKLPTEAVAERYHRIQLSTTLRVRTDNFGEAQAYMREA